MLPTRNIGIIAHVDAGKTTLSERILLYTGRIRQAGETHDGGARLDHESAEKKHGITITAAAVTCHWQDCQINLIDTPGHVDFTIEVERSLRVLDGAVCVFDSVAGVEAQTETVWSQADRFAVPRLCFVNKLDRVDGNVDRVVEQIQTRLRANPVVITMPLGTDKDLVGVIDIVAMKSLVWKEGSDGSEYVVGEIPIEYIERANAYRQVLLETCAMFSDSIVEAILEDRDVSKTDLIETLRKATCAGLVTPVLCGSAYKNIGVQPLLDAVIAYLPSPDEGALLVDLEGRGSHERTREQPYVGLCFKVAFDRHGQTSFVRVYSGVMQQGDKVVSSRTGQIFRISRLVRMFADTREDVKSLQAGEIGAVVGLAIASGDTLHAPNTPFALERILPPDALVEVAVEAATSKEDEKLNRALARITRADPSLRLRTDEETGQRRLAGMGQLHLEIAMEKLATEYGVIATMGAPQVAYRQTFAKALRIDKTLKKQSGGPGMFAKISLQIDVAERGSGFVFVDKSTGGALSREFVRGVSTGIASAMETGIDGIPIVDLQVTLLDGATHVQDSSEMAFQMAAQMAVREAAEKAGCLRLEPVMKLEVDMPPDNTGSIVADISRRKGRVIAIDSAGETSTVNAMVPLAETFGFAGSLSAMTGGRGRFRIHPAGYAISS